VNAFIDAKIDGQVPFVEVAFYTHGQGSPGEKNDHIRQIQPLTRDLDKISEELFALSTTGSAEYCGAAISRATNELKWDEDPDTYKAIFIAGNESFFQGSMDAKKACSAAITKGIIVNTIHCGQEQKGIDGGWSTGAKLADGSFLELNTKLNKTYVTYNEIGKSRVKMQVANDARNEKLSRNAAVNRVQSKSTSNYYNSSWDLVDASKDKDLDWSKLKDENLPEELKGKTTEERKAWVAEKQKERTAIQKEIAELSVERQNFVAEEREKLAEENGEALDTVMKKVVVEQAKKKGYEFSK